MARRIELIETDRNISLIEQPEYKRRWNTEPWESQLERALRDWLLDRLESYFDLDGRMNERGEVTARGELHEPRLTSVAKLADVARQDADLMQVAELYTGPAGLRRRAAVELRQQQLPAEASWATAVDRAVRIFGAAGSPLLNAVNLAKLTDGIQGHAKQHADACRRLVAHVAGHLADFGVAKDGAARYQTAEAMWNLIQAVRDTKPAAVIETLANLKPTTSDAAMGTSLTSAAAVIVEMAATQWKLFESIRNLQDDRAVAAEALLTRVADALKSDEHVTALGPVLRTEQSKAIDLLAPPPPNSPEFGYDRSKSATSKLTWVTEE